MIPKVIHQIWLGDKPRPSHYAKWMRSWRDHFPTWEYRLWTRSDFDGLLPQFLLPELFDLDQNPALLSDVLRMELLHLFGGMYADCDFECLSPMEHLFQDGHFHYGDEHAGEPGNAWLCSAPGHRITGLYLKQLRHSLTERVPVGTEWRPVFNKTGPGALIRLLNYWVGCWNGEPLSHQGDTVGMVYPGKVVGFWHEALFPYGHAKDTWQNFTRERYPLALAVHHWAGSWHD